MSLEIELDTNKQNVFVSVEDAEVLFNILYGNVNLAQFCS